MADAAKQVEQFPVYGTIRTDRTWQSNAVLTELEDGYFRNAALLWDGIVRDDRCAAVLHTRCSALTGLPVEMIPAGPSELEIRVARDAEKNFKRLFPDWWVFETVRWGQGLGVSVSIQRWAQDADGWWPNLEIFHPSNLQFTFGTMTYEASHVGGLSEVTRGGDWFLYTPMGYYYGWRRALLLQMANLYLMRQWNYRDWARANEVYGIPIRKAIVPEAADKDLKKQFLKDISNLGNEAAVQLPQSAENKFDVELLEAESDLHLSFKDFMDQLNASIAISANGQNLTTEVKGGSFAAAQIHEGIQATRFAADGSGLAQDMHEQVLREWARRNYGSEALAPKPRYKTEAPEDKAKQAQTLKTLAEALTGFIQAGAPIDVRSLLEKFEVPLKAMADQLLPGALPVGEPGGETDNPPTGKPPALNSV